MTLGTQESSLSIPIGTADTGTGGPEASAIARRLVWEKFKNGEESNEIIVDLYPSNVIIQTFVTAGFLSSGSPRSKPFSEVLIFSNTDKVSLRYSNVTFLSITKIGTFKDANTGLTVGGSAQHDSVNSEITFSRPIYGTVKVEYTAPYRRFTYTFNGTCPGSPPPIDPVTLEETPIFTQATLIALWDQNNIPAVATLAVTNENDRCPFAGQDGEQLNLVIEIVRSGGDGKAPPFGEYHTVLRFVPAGLALTLNVNEGAVPVKCNSQPETFQIKNQYLQYNNTASISVRYPMINISIAIDGAFTDQFGVEFLIADHNIAKPNDIINDGVWKNSTVFEGTGISRVVKRGEIVITDGFGNIKPAFGILIATYDITYDTYLYAHKIDEIPTVDGEGVIIHGRDAVLTVKETSVVNGLIQIIPLPGLTIAVTGIVGDSCLKSFVSTKHEMKVEYGRVFSNVWVTPLIAGGNSGGIYHSTGDLEADTPESVAAGAAIEMEVVHEIRHITSSGDMVSQHFEVSKAKNKNNQLKPYTNKTLRKTDSSDNTMQEKVYQSKHKALGDAAEALLKLKTTGLT